MKAIAIEHPMRLLVLMALFGGAMLFACDKSTPPPPAPTPRDAPAPDATGKLTVVWSNVVRTDGCFFFSGPEGRDDQLVGEVKVETVEKHGDDIRVRVGTALFAGTYSDGQLRLERKAEYDFNGPWTTKETIQGALRRGQIEATYRYEECEVRSKDCPGRCVVTGTLMFSKEL